MRGVTYRIFPYAGGWTLTLGEETYGPYWTVDIPCRLALSFIKLREARGGAARLLFEDRAGELHQLWPRYAGEVRLAARAPWTVYSRG
jgi:hypothetical protein